MSVELIPGGDEKNAKLTLRLRANSGFSSTVESKVSPNQWGEIIAITEDGSRRKLYLAAEEMAALLEWIGAFADVRSQDDSKTFARVNRGALRTIRDKARELLVRAAPNA